MQNSTVVAAGINVSDGLHLCHGNQLCLNNSLAIFTYIINIAVVIANLLHFIVIGRMYQLNGTPYKIILRALSVVDIAMACIFITVNDCRLRVYINTSSNIVGPVLSFLFNSVATCKFYLIALESQEKYLGICKPFELHQQNVSTVFKRLLRPHILPLYLCMLLLIRDIMFYPNLCVDLIWGPTLYHHSIGGSAVTVLVTLPAVIFATVRSCSIVNEINRLRNSGLELREGRHARTCPIHTNCSNKYTKLEMLANAVFLIPIIPFMIFDDGRNPTYQFFNFVAVFMFQWHGVVGTVTRGWMKKHYRQQIKFMFTCRPKTASIHRVEPAVLSMDEPPAYLEDSNPPDVEIEYPPVFQEPSSTPAVRMDNFEVNPGATIEQNLRLTNSPDSLVDLTLAALRRGNLTANVTVLTAPPTLRTILE